MMLRVDVLRACTHASSSPRSCCQPVSVDGSTRIYHIAVTPGLGDSPYAAQGVWGFAIYSLSARALRESP